MSGGPGGGTASGRAGASGNASANSNNSNAASTDSKQPVGVGKNLPATNQTYHPMINLKNPNKSKIFDHPLDMAANGIYGQSNPKNKIKGTCGLCSSGTISNVCGNHFTVDDMLNYALPRKLCSETGGTKPSDRANIIEGMTGVPVDVVQKGSLEELVPYVENGQGVIIAIEPRLYMSEWYGDFDPTDPKGHAVVLASVIRDTKTNKITKYVVIDSNGENPGVGEAVQYVEPSVLQNAFRFKGGLANITRNIIH